MKTPAAKLTVYHVRGVKKNRPPLKSLGYAHIFLRLCAFNGGTVIRGGPEYELPYFLSLLLTECDSVTPNSFERRRTCYVGRTGTIWGSTVG